jgi:hypothetical protein
MYCGSPNLPQTRKSSLKLNNTGDNGHIRLRYAKRKSFHEQVADQIIQSVVKKGKISLLDLGESELSDFCPDSAMLKDNGHIADGLNLPSKWENACSLLSL